MIVDIEEYGDDCLQFQGQGSESGVMREYVALFNSRAVSEEVKLVEEVPEALRVDKCQNSDQKDDSRPMANTRFYTTKSDKSSRGEMIKAHKRAKLKDALESMQSDYPYVFD